MWNHRPGSCIGGNIFQIPSRMPYDTPPEVESLRKGELSVQRKVLKAPCRLRSHLYPRDIYVHPLPLDLYHKFQASPRPRENDTSPKTMSRWLSASVRNFWITCATTGVVRTHMRASSGSLWLRRIPLTIIVPTPLFSPPHP